jgi:hypothetical protein
MLDNTEMQPRGTEPPATSEPQESSPQERAHSHISGLITGAAMTLVIFATLSFGVA